MSCTQILINRDFQVPINLVGNNGALWPMPGTWEVRFYNDGSPTPIITATLGNLKLASVSAGQIVLNVLAADTAALTAGYGFLEIARTDAGNDVLVRTGTRHVAVGEVLLSGPVQSIKIMVDTGEVAIRSSLLSNMSIANNLVTDTQNGIMPSTLFAKVNKVFVVDNLVAYSAKLTLKNLPGENGLRFDHEGEEAIDLRLFGASKKGMIIHGYTTYGASAVGLQIDWVQEFGTMITLKQAWNTAYPGTWGRASFFELIEVSGYLATPQSMVTWTYDNKLLLSTRVLNFFGFGLKIDVPSGKSLYGVEITHSSALASSYAIKATGKQSGSYILKDTAGGYASVIFNTAAGETNELIFAAQYGTGPFIRFRDSALAIVASVERNGDYQINGNKIITARRPALPGVATDLATAIARINALADGVSASTGATAHGLFA